MFAPLLGFALTLSIRTEPDLLIQHANVIDSVGNGVRKDIDVLVVDGRIKAIGKNLKDDAASKLDAKGKFLIPGLWDMHVHGTAVPGFLGIYLANGITGVRDMFDPGDMTFKLRDKVNSGEMVGPHIVAAGKILDGPKPIWQGSIAVADADQGRAAVGKALGQGSDFIKVYSLLPHDAYMAIAAECKKRGVVFCGHVPETVSADEASDAGQKSFEHLYSILRGCSDKPEMIAHSFPFGVTSEVYRVSLHGALDYYDPKKASALFAKLRKNGSWQCPTFTVLNSFAHPNADRPEVNAYYPYLPGWMKSIGPGLKGRIKGWTPEDYKLEDELFKKDLKTVGEMYRAHVPLLAGTDVMNPYCFPGFSLHDELDWFVKAGIPTVDVLKIATRNAAVYLGKDKDLGTIEEGKIADLVLLDADPIRDIDNTRKIDAVILGGKLLDRAALDKLMPKQTKVAAMPKNLPVGAYDDDYGF
jgi:hypothetical protein